jgi:hypothetical protein
MGDQGATGIVSRLPKRASEFVDVTSGNATISRAHRELKPCLDEVFGSVVSYCVIVVRESSWSGNVCCKQAVWPVSFL